MYSYIAMIIIYFLDFLQKIVQDLLEGAHSQQTEASEKNSVEIQVCIPPACKDAQTQIAPEINHICIGKQLSI